MISDRVKKRKFKFFSISVDLALKFRGFKERTFSSLFDDYVYLQG